MPSIPSRLSAFVVAVVAILSTWFAAVPAHAAVFYGYDVSYPNCAQTLPSDRAFAVVGVNGGIASTVNRCLSDQLSWAKNSSGLTKQPKIQLYVNTGNPMLYINPSTGLPTDTWKLVNLNKYADRAAYGYSNPYGTCVADSVNTAYGAKTAACAYLYGWDRAQDDIRVYFAAAASAAGVSTTPSAYRWWLDVETGNSWASGSNAYLTANVADLEGMVAAFAKFGLTKASYGVYSTSYQWGVITGGLVKTTSPLYGALTWYTVGGPYSVSTGTSKAQKACGTTGLSGGKIVLTQFWDSVSDYDLSCTG